ncbi:MAG: DUF262 domain-containing protein [Candidatus Pacearchaeota archaeon]
MNNNTTTTEIWDVRRIVNSLSGIANQKLLIPTYQRNLVWSDKQKDAFIESLKNDWPVGSILLYDSGFDKDGKKNYLIIDGLQRSTTLLSYHNTPTKYFKLDKDLLDQLYTIFGDIDRDNLELIVTNWINSLNGFEETDGFSSYAFAKHVIKELQLNFDIKEFDSIVAKLIPVVKTIKLQADVSNIKIPVIVYSGDQNNLPIIFERLNSFGTKLSKYQIFSATWTGYESISIENKEITQLVKDKYDSLIEKGLQIENYDPVKFADQKFSIFEYFFGLSKLLCEKYPTLFNGSDESEQIESVGFNLGAVCLGLTLQEMRRIPEIYNQLSKELRIKFEKALFDSIQYVYDLLKPYIELKLNRKFNKTIIHHSEYQIVSIIGKIFLTKYDHAYEVKSDWKEQEKKFRTNLVQHYVFDIIRDFWRGSGDSKCTEVLRNDRYSTTISKQSWENTLTEYYNYELSKKEKIRSVIKPNSLLILKCIYSHLLTVHEELSTDKFELDHVIPFSLLKDIDSDGLAISAIPNICLIKKELNREKYEKPLYTFLKEKFKNEEEPDKQILQIEKLTLTLENDTKDFYNNPSKENYYKFLEVRWSRLKELFYKGLKI